MRRAERAAGSSTAGAVGERAALAGAVDGALVVQAGEDRGDGGAGESGGEGVLELGRGERALGGPQGGQDGGFQLAGRASRRVVHRAPRFLRMTTSP
ncbi:hypothetical protein GCM10020229_57730 [Kitasatospora albolonga]